MKLWRHTLFIVSLATALLIPALCFAIGEFSVGLNIGITSDPNNLDSEINRYNTVMEVYKEETSGAKISTLTVPYSPAYGFSFRYQFNFFLIRMGCHFTRPIGTNKGSVTPPGGEKNTIRITTYQNSFPATIGLLLPLKDRTYFYIGVGPTYHQTYVKITQSKPEQTSTLFSNAGLSTNRRDRYAVDFIGYHLMLGAEVPLWGKFTLSTEWIHQEGRSYPLQNGGVDQTGNDVYTPRKIINVKGDFILFGINYYIGI